MTCRVHYCRNLVGVLLHQQRAVLLTSPDAGFLGWWGDVVKIAIGPGPDSLGKRAWLAWPACCLMCQGADSTVRPLLRPAQKLMSWFAANKGIIVAGSLHRHHAHRCLRQHINAFSAFFCLFFFLSYIQSYLIQHQFWMCALLFFFYNLLFKPTVSQISKPNWTDATAKIILKNKQTKKQNVNTRGARD